MFEIGEDDPRYERVAALLKSLGAKRFRDFSMTTPTLRDWVAKNAAVAGERLKQEAAILAQWERGREVIRQSTELLQSGKYEEARQLLDPTIAGLSRRRVVCFTLNLEWSHFGSEDSKRPRSCTSDSAVGRSTGNAPSACRESTKRADLPKWCGQSACTKRRCQPRHSACSQSLRGLRQARARPSESKPCLHARYSHSGVARLARGKEGTRK
jgi:hypothetical protein